MTTGLKRQPIPFGKYLLLDRINIGGMAEVWRGKQLGASGFERLVAIKRILPNIAEDEEFITMFIDEAKITVQLTHANIAQVYELGHIQNSYFIAMEYIAGKDMRAIFDRCRKKSEPAPVPLTCYAVSKMCEGLDYAHRKKDGMSRDMNIVHRDISPQNILISYEGEVKVIDFGIAKAAGKASKTQAGILKGKFAYMSPEQIRGLPLDRRSDVFAIGVCLYEMLTGERLFVGDSDFSVLEKVRKAEVTPPSHFNKRVPEALEKIVLKALAKEVDDRYQYASEVADDLQRFLITSDSIFSRKDLMQYMKSTFAEDVEREKLRTQEYADLQTPDGVFQSAELANLANEVAPGKISATFLSPFNSRGSGGAEPPRAAPPVLIPAGTVPAVPGAFRPVAGPPGEGPRRTPSLTLLPKLTAAAPMLSNNEDPGAGATVLVDGNRYNGGESPGAFADVATDPTEKPAVPETGPALLSPAPAQPLSAPPSSDATAIIQPKSLTPAAPPQGLTPEPLTAAMSPARKRASNPAVPSVDRRFSRDHIRVATPPAHPDAAAAAITAPVAPRLQAPAPPAVADTAPGLFAGMERKQILLFSAAGAVIAALVALVIILLVRPQAAALGWLVVYVPADLQGKAHVNINGHDEEAPQDASKPLMKQIPAGKALVLVTAEGYEPFTGDVVIQPGQAVAQVRPVLKRIEQTSELVIAVEPEQAEIRIDGEVVKREGDKNGIYVGQVHAGTEIKVEIRRAGFKRWESKLAAPSGGEPLRKNVRLDPAEFSVAVSSEPKGAAIFVNGREVGITPASVTVAGSAGSVVLKKKCYQEADLPLKFPDAPGAAPLTVNASLKKQPGCR